MNIREFERKLRKLNKRGIPFAELETINRAAFETQKDVRQNLGDDMTLRNSWTVRSVLVNRATLSTMESSVGSVQPYMETQEKGGTETSTGKHGVTIPTSVASGEGRNAKPRRKAVRRPNRVSNIQLAKTARSSNRKQRNAIAISTAVRTGKRYVFLELQQRKGIFRIYGGKRKPRIEMIQDLTRRSITTPRNPWLLPRATAQAQRLPAYYADALQRQLDRLR